ncbi:3953_t:CDS:1, partial [Funneliformis geosporum]
PANRVLSLKDPLKKMSKSNPLELSRINLTDSPENISQKNKPLQIRKKEFHIRLMHVPEFPI